jgi:DNA gyrase/topoisomerase IV subunit A
MVAIKEVTDTDDIVVITMKGVVIRQHASDVRVAGRNTQGVRLIRLDEGDTVADVAAVVAEDEEDKKLEEADKASGKGKTDGGTKDEAGGSKQTKEKGKNRNTPKS